MWQEEGLEEHFQKAKKLLMLACTLTHPDPNAPLAMTTDASKKGIGGTLEQFSDNVWRMEGFVGKTTTPPRGI